jgi:hypothetical protein
MNNSISYAQIHHFFCQFLLLCYWMTMMLGLPELWWTNQEFSPVNIIPPWFSMRDEEYASW